MIPNGQTFGLVVTGVFLLAVSSVSGADRQPEAAPTPSGSPVQPEQRWKQIDLYRSGQKAYAQKKYAEAFKQLVAFKAANQEIFLAPPRDLEPVAKEISNAITYSETQLSAKSAAGAGSSITPTKSDRKSDGIRTNGHPGMSDIGSGDKGARLSGAHDDIKSDRERASKDAGGDVKGSSGASARERP
jgi:hypothetical protein